MENNIEILKAGLFSGIQTTVIETIDRIRKSSCFEVTDALFDLYLTTQSPEIKNNLFQLFIDIKDVRFADKIVEYLLKRKYTSIIYDIVSITWQSGVDVSKKIDVFVDIFIEKDLKTAIECFTVIEENAYSLPNEKRFEICSRISARLADISSEKKELATELIKCLS